MAFHLPTDLISQVQIAARNDAGLHSYTPDDPSRPSLPSFDASIFGLDPSTPSYLRCKNCKGKLLRGIQSVICIYCGQQQQSKDLSPEPISFTSTFGYKWLLQSLELDESETVGASTEEPESNRGHNTPKQETSLHHLLDLQITWPDELDKPDTIVTNKTSEQSSSSLNLNRADLDNVFSGSKRDLVSNASAQPIQEKQLDSLENKGSGFVQENLTLFTDVHSADSTVKSSEDNQGDSFSGWAADFQSANKDDGSNSYDPFMGSKIDLSSHIDSVFGAGKNEIPGKLKDDLQPAQHVSDDWMQDDLWKNVDSKVSQEAVHTGTTAEAADGILSNNFENPASASDGVDWFEDNQWQTSITSEPSNKITDKHDASYDDWNDFASSSDAVNLSGNVWKDTDNGKAVSSEQTSEINLFSSSSNIEDDEFGSFSQPNFFSATPAIHGSDAMTNNILDDFCASDRNNDAQSHINQLHENGAALNVAAPLTPPKNEVDILMSQMHDLSFMLEMNLTVPSKVDGQNSTRKD